MSEIEYQRKLLGDGVRNLAFHDALKEIVVPGKTTVADVGAGTGFLSFLARRLGAKHCTLIEYSDTLALAEELARRNRIDGLSFVHGHSLELDLKRKVNLVVSETLGHYALEENLLETLMDARRFLKPGGTILPCGLRQYVAPVLHSRLQDELDVWPRIGFELDYTPARERALNNMYVKHILPADLCSVELEREWDVLNFSPTAPTINSRRRKTVRWAARELRDNQAAQVFGFALWWEAELIPGVAISTSPFMPRTHWDQVYLPLLQPLDLEPQDHLELELTSDTRPEVGVRVSWTSAVQRGGQRIHEQQQDMFKGRL